MGIPAPPEARMPLSTAGSEPYDQRILGSWLSETQNNKIFHFHLKARSKPNMLDGTGIYMELRKSDLGKTNPPAIEGFTAVVHSSQLDGSTYYNIKRLSSVGSDYGAAKDNNGYIIARANLVNDHTLKICLMDHSAIGNAIDNGVLKGVHVKEDESMNIKLDYYFVDVSPTELIKFIQESKKSNLFSECLMFKKSRSSARRPTTK